MKIRHLLCFIFFTTAVFFGAHAHAAYLNEDILVTNAWVQAMPPSQKTTAAYRVITNNSPKEAVLVSAWSDIAETAEIHQMSDMNGMMNMAMASNIHIPAKGKVILQPGGFHIMLINLKQAVNKGDLVSIRLHFQDRSTTIVSAQVKSQE